MSAVLQNFAVNLSSAELVGPPRPPEKQMGPIRRNLNAKRGQSFANDGSYESVEGLLTRLAIKAYARVQALKLNLDFEDVRADMDEFYLLAFRAWNPARGVRFVTYLQTACMHNFRNRVEKLVAERANLGMYSYDGRPGDMSDDDSDPLDRLDAMEDENRPEDRLAARQEMKERLKGLTPAAQRFVTALLIGETSTTLDKSATRLSNVALAAGLTRTELARVKVEITQKFGYEW
jgi:hypothetical protein